MHFEEAGDTSQLSPSVFFFFYYKDKIPEINSWLIMTTSGEIWLQSGSRSGDEGSWQRASSSQSMEPSPSPKLMRLHLTDHIPGAGVVEPEPEEAELFL